MGLFVEGRASEAFRWPEKGLPKRHSNKGICVSGPDIFISYSREERPAARHFADCFAREGFAVWWDAALRSGETFDEVIERELRAAKAVVVLWSPRSVASRWVRAEATLADRANKLVPVIIESCSLPIIFELTQAADMSTWTGDTEDHRWKDLISDLRRLIGPADVEATTAEPKAAEVKSPPVTALPEKPAAELLEPTAQEIEKTRFFKRSDEFREVESDKVHCLLRLDGEAEETRFAISPAGLKIGRTAPADIVVPGAGVSRAHCLVELAADQVRVTDLNSTNGTYVDNKRIERSEILSVGSMLRVGNVTFEHEVCTRAELQPRIVPADFDLGTVAREAKVARH
jgi:TIR domain/FHA domain